MKLISNKPKILVVCEKPGWILHRAAKELIGVETHSFDFFLVWGIKRKVLASISKMFNFNFFDIIYFFPYYLYDSNISKLGEQTVSHLTHFELDSEFKNAKWFQVLRECDFFTVLSSFTEIQIPSRIDRSKVEIIPYGLSHIYQPTFHILLSGNLGKRKGNQFFMSVREMCEKANLRISWMATKQNDWNLEYFDYDNSNLTIPYSWADLLLVTSELEGGHIGTVEALSMSLPVLSTPVGWAYKELRKYIHVAESPNAMFKIIETMYRSWDVQHNNYEPLQRAFSYQTFRQKHSQLFSRLLNS